MPHRNLGIIIGFMMFFLATALLATEYITAAKSKGEVLVFRRGHVPPEAEASADDEEAVPVIHNFGDLDKNTKERTAGDFAGLHRQTSIFHWEDVCYDIKINNEPRRLLDNIDGWVEPGTLTALMVGPKCYAPIRNCLTRLFVTRARPVQGKRHYWIPLQVV